jgi:hypothetical protein
MALNFGELLGGIGAAMGGTAPQYVQDLKSRKQAELVAREKAMYQDAAIALQLFETKQFEKLDALGMDRMDQLKQFSDAVPNDTLRMLSLNKLGMSGDLNARAQLHAELISANRAGQVKGYLSAPEQVKGVEVAGELRNPYTGALMGAAATPERKYITDPNGIPRYVTGEAVFPNVTKDVVETKPPIATSDLGRINQDYTAGLISLEQRNDAVAAIEAKTQSDVETISTATTARNEKAALVATELGRANVLVDKLLSNTGGLSGATGAISSRIPSLRGATVDFEADLSELQSLLTLGNLGRMTGVLSESDIKILREAASGLQIGGSEDRMRKKLAEIGDRLKLKLTDTGGSPVQEVTSKPVRVVNGFTIEEL